MSGIPSDGELLGRCYAENQALQAALDEANSERERLRRALAGHLFDGESLSTREAIRSELISQGFEAAAAVQRVTALPGEWLGDSNNWYYENLNETTDDPGYAEGFEAGWDHAAERLRAALAGEGSGKPTAKPGPQDGDPDA